MSAQPSPARPGDVAVYVVTAVVVVLAIVVFVAAAVTPHTLRPKRRVVSNLRDSTEPEEGPEVAPSREGEVLALVHAPWCTHCKRLVPVFEQLRARGFHVALVDGSTRGTEWLVANQVAHYPTVCVMIGDKVLQKYPSSGERTENSILRFYSEVGLPQPNPLLSVTAAASETVSTTVDPKVPVEVDSLGTLEVEREV